ncbi:MAG: metal-sensitive transcriptional regulator [Spirochaeta sp.]
MVGTELKQKLLARLRRVEGQVSGVSRMIEQDRYCMDVLAQTRAVISAMRKVEQEILKNHMQTCVAEAFDNGDAAERDRRIAEVIRSIDTLAG